MSETPETDPFAELVADIENEFDKALFNRRAVNTIAAAQVTGAVYREAIGSGVPHDLAQAMAAEYWTAEMTPQAGDELANPYEDEDDE